MPALLPPAKRRFVSFTINSTFGNSRRIASAVPSVEALSTTRIRALGYFKCCSDFRHSSVSSLPFQVSMIRYTRGASVISIFSKSLCQFSKHLRSKMEKRARVILHEQKYSEQYERRSLYGGVRFFIRRLRMKFV